MSTLEKFITDAKKPGTDIEALCAEMTDKATIYRKAKDDQRRWFPSAMRRVRLSLADTIKNIGDLYKAKLASVKEHEGLEELEKYYKDNYKKYDERKKEKIFDTEVKKETKEAVSRESVKKHVVHEKYDPLISKEIYPFKAMLNVLEVVRD